MIKIKYIFIIAMIAAVSLYAHGDKKHGEKKAEKTVQDTITLVGEDTIAINGKPYTAAFVKHDDEHSEEMEEAEHSDEDEHESEEISLSSLFEHVHNKLIHFPIAFGILLFIFALIGYKQEVCHRASKIIVVLGILATIAAIIAGLSQTTPFEGKEIYSVVELHRNIGFLLLGLYLVTGWAIFTRKSTTLQLILTGLLVLVIGAVGFYGGVIAH